MTKTKTKSSHKPEEKKQAVKSLEFYHAVGRRKGAAARVRLYVPESDKLEIDGRQLKKGEVVVNERLVVDYFPGKKLKKLYLEPFRTTNTLNRFVTTIKVVGGGVMGQLGAVIHGVSRALEQVDPKRNRPILKKRGFLTRDARVKQRRKAGYAQKARAKKQSPKR